MKKLKVIESDEFSRYLEGELGVKVEREVKFHPTRRWRFDYAIPDYLIAIEIEGGIFVGGRHTSAVGFAKDMEKYNSASALGWSVIRFLPKERFATKTLDTIREVMQQNKDIRLNTRVDAETWAALKMICEETGIRSPYKILQIILKWFVDFYKQKKTRNKDTLGECVRKEIEEEFERLANEWEANERGKHFTTDRRNGK